MEINGPRHGDSREGKGVQATVIRQFRLHEVPHHTLRTGLKTGYGSVVPIAHTPADIYKFLHQGEFGIGHIVDDPMTFGNNLARDLLKARPEADRPILEDVSRDGTVFRVNLRPYRLRFKDDEDTACACLLKACLESAERVRGSGERFLAALARFRDLNRAGSLVVDGMVFAFASDTLDSFLMEVADFVQTYNSLPILSHSLEYKRLNNPSYRVLDLETLKNSELSRLL
ncbi:MAG: hypothetical protein RDU20_02490 [Desulfomonilaceae bacterium]|nr:hypothetical protein [Desulfomonilaceae bacterium]